MTQQMKKSVFSPKRTVINKVVMAVLLTGVSSAAFSHGFITDEGEGVASARGTLCSKPMAGTGDKNVNCGGIEWEPQSIEGPDGFPEGGPADGHIASGDNSRFSPLDEQTADRWVKTKMTAGENVFRWKFTAKHKTRDFKYYMTKPGWNPNQPLTRDSFDLEPFCTIDGHNQLPPTESLHHCMVPEREGYQVILAVWDVADTVNAFYNTLDVKFDGEGPVPVDEWERGGQIIPQNTLSVGDEVYTRVFDSTGEKPAYSTKLEITSKLQGQPNRWSHDLAEKINKERTNIQAGDFDGEETFTPIYGANPIYLKDSSGLTNVEIDFNTVSPLPEYDLSVSGLESEYVISEQPTVLDLALTAEGDVTAELRVVNHANETLASYTGDIKDGDTTNVTMELSKSEAGHHMLVEILKDSEGNFIKQTTEDFHLVDQSQPQDYDYVFPENVKSYTEGTKVLASDGAVYQCKPFPYSGYCKQWSETAPQFAPGTGSDWTTAWDKL